MSHPPKIFVLCSGRLAVPAVQQLAAAGALLGMAVPDTDPRASELLRQLAASLGCPFFNLSRKPVAAQITDLQARYQPDAFFVIGFPWRIPESVLGLAPAGFLNFHGGPLPALRGPDPLFEAIRNELTETALTVHRMDAGLDTGPVVWADPFPLAPDITHGLLSTQMAFQCARAIPALLERLQQGVLPAQPQPSDGRYYPRVAPADLHIQWQTQPATAIAALIRACNPIYGGAATTAAGWTFRLTDAAVLTGATYTAPPGTLLELSLERGALVQCLNSAILQVFVVGTDEGYFPAFRLQGFGLAPGVLFQSAFATPQQPSKAFSTPTNA